MEILDPQRFVPGMEIEPAHLEPVMVRRLKEDLVGWAIDTHDREVLAWTASPRSIGGIAVRDLMLLAVERRFGTLAAPQPVEWLADNGSCFTAHETVAFAHAIGLVPCFTPVRSPESNGIAEAFVKTFKRDYVRLNPRPDATTVMARSIPGSRTTMKCTRTAPSGCAHLASSSGRINPPPVRSDGATPDRHHAAFVCMQVACKIQS
jgi:transposase InsO family protein